MGPFGFSNQIGWGFHPQPIWFENWVLSLFLREREDPRQLPPLVVDAENTLKHINLLVHPSPFLGSRKMGAEAGLASAIREKERVST
jgi:hypothetical protein